MASLDNTQLAPGTVLEGKYRIEEVTGEGGNGVVYRAEHAVLGRSFAVKVLSAPTNDEDELEAISRFRSQARAVSQLAHPNIVSVVDFGITEDLRPFYVMEHLDGETLEEVLRRKRRLAHMEAVEVADSVADALIVAHKAGFLHLDLTPANVFLARGPGARPVVKVLDFAVAVCFKAPPTPTQGTGMRFLSRTYGTVGYAAPESLMGFANPDERADVFGLGVLLFEMVTGRRPFTGASESEIIEATVSGPVPSPRSLCPEISVQMERLILTALAKDPDQRFRSVREMLDELTAAAVGRSSDAFICRTDVQATKPPDYETPYDGLPMPRWARLAKGEIVEEERRGGTSSFRAKGSLWRWAVGLGVAAALAIGAGVVFSGRSRETSTKEPSRELAAPAHEPQAAARIWLDLTPRWMTVRVDGVETSKRPLMCGLGEILELSFEADGHIPEFRDVECGGDQYIEVRLDRKDSP